jgi:phosphonate transport system substrate-binding protein
VLDPVASLRQRLRLEPGARVRLTFATGVAASRESAVALAHKYHDAAASTSGHLCPMQLLKDQGIDPMKDIDRVHTKRNIMHEALKRGDVAAIGYNHNSWLLQARNKDKNTPAGAFRIIARSGDLPNDMIVVGAHVDPAVAEKFQKGLLGNKAEAIKGILAHQENSSRYTGMDLHAVKDSDYGVVRAMYATIGYPQYSQFVGD